MGTQTHTKWHFRKLNRRIKDLVGQDVFSLWSIDGDQSFEILRMTLENSYGRPLNDKEFIALIRGKLQQLFGSPTVRVQNRQSSFLYELEAKAGKEKVFFQIRDRQAEELVIYWEFSTSEADVRNKVKMKLFELLLTTVPADFSDMFSCEDDILVAYGCKSRKPWADIEISMNVKRRMFQSNMKNLQEKHYRVEYSMNRFFESRNKLKLPILRIE